MRARGNGGYVFLAGFGRSLTIPVKLAELGGHARFNHFPAQGGRFVSGFLHR
jgi:hypothetical protein